MEQATIVNLAPRNSSKEAASFEQAFGAYSEFGGKGRDRRARRKADRIQKKKEKKLAKVSARDEVKTARKSARRGRKTDKMLDKNARKAIRADRRDEGVQRRQDRKTFKKLSRLERGELGSAAEEEYMDEEPIDNGGMMPESYGEQQGSEEEYDETEEEYDPNSESEEGEDDSYDEESEGAEEGDVVGEEEEETEEETEGSNFDGIMGAEDRFYEFHAKPEMKIAPEVQDIADKIEWNNELISRLRVKIAQARGKNIDTTPLMRQIDESVARVDALKKTLKNYRNFDGEFSCAEGVTVQAKNRRNGEIQRAAAIAKGKRLAIGKRKQAGKRIRHAGDVTPVDAELNPSFGKDRIVIPSKEGSSNATGLNGLDLVDDYDAPKVREINIGIDGSQSGTKINWTGVAIGGAIAVAAIWAIRKYKIL